MEKSLSTRQLLHKAWDEIRPDKDLIIRSVAASLLAGLAIYLDDMFVLLGAMLVAPFFDPIVSFTVFLVTGKWGKAFRAALAYLLIVAISLAVSLVFFWCLDLKVNLDSLNYISKLRYAYFFVAIVLGAVGTFLWIWPNTSNTSAGLSIAISLIPPLANLGRGLVMRDMDIASTASGLFFLNTLGIILGSSILLYVRERVKVK